MPTFSYKGKSYEVDEQGFLTDHTQWDEGFAEGAAVQVCSSGRLTDRHWLVIRFIRDEFQRSGDCPHVYRTRMANGLSTKEFRLLFPDGYLRGACKLAGITYRDRFIDYYGEPAPAAPAERRDEEWKRKTYRIDAFGFLVDPAEWDEQFAVTKARELKIAGGLGAAHWRVIRYLRNTHADTGIVPTVFQCCEANELELEDLEGLFPDGYQRGAVKIAGLRTR